MLNKGKLAKSVAVGTICSMLICVILTAVLAAVILSSGMLPAQLIDWITAGIMAVSAFAGGFIASKLNRGAGIPAGGFTGLAVFIVTVLTSFSRGESSVTAMIIIKLVCSVLLAVAGGILGIREKRGSKYGRF